MIGNATFFELSYRLGFLSRTGVLMIGTTGGVEEAPKPCRLFKFGAVAFPNVLDLRCLIGVCEGEGDSGPPVVSKSPGLGSGDVLVLTLGERLVREGRRLGLASVRVRRLASTRLASSCMTSREAMIPVGPLPAASDSAMGVRAPGLVDSCDSEVGGAMTVTMGDGGMGTFVGVRESGVHEPGDEAGGDWTAVTAGVWILGGAGEGGADGTAAAAVLASVIPLTSSSACLSSSPKLATNSRSSSSVTVTPSRPNPPSASVRSISPSASFWSCLTILDLSMGCNSLRT